MPEAEDEKRKKREITIEHPDHEALAAVSPAPDATLDWAGAEVSVPNWKCRQQTNRNERVELGVSRTRLRKWSTCSASRLGRANTHV